MPAITARATRIPGLRVLMLSEWQDSRGRMLKHYQESVFSGLGLPVHYPEEFVSVSRKGVLRGLHFQVPPAEQHKLVLCLEGSALDAVVDLRRGSPAYGKYALFELSGGTPRMLCLPPGTAHGFLAREEGTVMLYRVTSEHVPELDLGIRWDSAGVPWGLEAQAPVLSARDLQWPKLQNFVSPFVFDGAKQSVFAGGAAQAGGDPCV